MHWTVWLDTRSVHCFGAKVKRGLSAGRVQSVALRIIADREDEINAFIPEEYWTLDTILKVKKVKKRPLTAKFYGTVDKNDDSFRGRDESDFGKKSWRMQNIK